MCKFEVDSPVYIEYEGYEKIVVDYVSESVKHLHTFYTCEANYVDNEDDYQRNDSNKIEDIDMF